MLAEQSPLTIEQILDWVDVHYERTGRWPVSSSGRILDAPGESWLAVSLALMRGSRGLLERSSLSELLKTHRGIKSKSGVPPLSIPQILTWADAYHARTGKWPNPLAGPIPEAPGESWRKMQGALVKGGRGLPCGSSLAQLLAAHRGLRNSHRPPDLSLAQILVWADAFHARTGRWPKPGSGSIPEAPGESWQAVEAALKAGKRGFKGGSDLTELLAEHRDWSLMRRPQCEGSQVPAWANEFHASTGRWPKRHDGPIPESPRESWMGVHRALQSARRGLPRYSSLTSFLRARMPNAGIATQSLPSDAVF